MNVDATKETFEHVELFGKPALFTDCRVDICTVPLGFYCYDLRGLDKDPGRPVALEQHAGVNHAGAVLAPKPVKIPKSGYKRLKDGLNFLGEEMTLKDFCAEYGIDYTPRFVIRPASNDEAGIFYAMPPEKDELLGAVGHVRIDFGQDGKEFWHTWHPRSKESLNSPAFKEELGRVVDQLRDSVLKGLRSMSRFCYDHGGAIEGGWRQNYGYMVETEHYRYCLRCSPSQGDYHAYLTCFDMDVQRDNLVKNAAMERNQPAQEEKGILKQLSEHKGQIQEKDAAAPKTKQNIKKKPSL